MKEKEKEIVTKSIKELFVGIKLWFLSDDIKIDDERMKCMFNITIDKIKKQI